MCLGCRAFSDCRKCFRLLSVLLRSYLNWPKISWSCVTKYTRCSRQCRPQELTHGPYGLFLTCRKKERISHFHIQSHLLYYEVISTSIVDQKLIHTWVAKALLALCKGVHPGFCLKADWFTFASAMWLRTLPRASHVGGLAWLPTTWLAQILL